MVLCIDYITKKYYNQYENRVFLHIFRKGEAILHKFEKVVDGIYVLKIPFSVVWTGVILVTGEKNFLIDSGSEPPEKYLIPALGEMGMSLDDIDWLLNTHCHGDHITGHYDLVDKYGLKVATFEGGAGALTDPASNAVRIRTKFPEYSPAPQSWLRGVVPTKLLADGEILEGRLQVIHTPGHDHDCVCWYDIPTKTIITGDSLQGNGTPTQGIGFYQSLSEYLSSLGKLASVDIDNIILGHDYDGIGGVVLGKENSREALLYCGKMVVMYDKLVRQYLSEGLSDPAEMATRMINEIGCGMPEKLFLALYTVTNHLNKINNDF